MRLNAKQLQITTDGDADLTALAIEMGVPKVRMACALFKLGKKMKATERTEKLGPILKKLNPLTKN